MIFANHTHVFPKEVNEEGSLDSLLNVLDECGIDKSVVFPPFVDQVPNNYKPNLWLYEELKKDKYKNLVGFGIINFKKDVEKQVEEIKQLGFKGLKLHPAFQGFNVLNEKAYKIYEKAQNFGFPICFHTSVHWHKLSDYHPLKFDEIAQDFPELNIILEHVGGFSFFQEAIAVISNNLPPVSEKKGNVYGGLTSIFTEKNYPNRYLPQEKINRIIPMIGAGQLILGLDFPYYKTEEIKQALDYIDNLNLDEKEKEKILGKNLIKLIEDL